MSRLNVFLILILFGLLFFAQTGDASLIGSSVQQAQISPTVIPTVTPIPTPTTPPVGAPTTIFIPKIMSQAAPVVAVDVDDAGKMEMPQGGNAWFQAAWFSGADSHKPGEVGNSVIAGHLDQVTGAPALFWSLSKLVPGDQVIVSDENGKQYTFVVTSKQVYPYDQVPLDQVFGESDKVRLNLMTCTGIFNHATHNYSMRVVVYTELVQ